LSAAAKAGERLQLSFNYTRTEAKNDTANSANFGLDLARRARDTANAGISYRWPIELTTSIAAQYVGSSFDDAANAVKLSSYTLLDLRAVYAYSKTVSVYARVENALDQSHETSGGFGSIGRTLSAGVRSNF
jgi:vitamin B12 transporter